MLNTVIDLSHHNVVNSFDEIAAAGITGIIHKASEGFRFTDKKYWTRKQYWKDQLKLLWGAYHFCSPGSGVDQAKHFIDTVNPDDQTLLVLDYESGPTGRIMSIAEAEKFVQYVKDVTGRYPGLYSGSDLRHQLGNRMDSILRECWLWVARYGGKPIVPKAWKTWTMWQYTDGTVSSKDAAGNWLPKTVQGMARPGGVDRNCFNGKFSQLLKIWNVPELTDFQNVAAEIPDIDQEIEKL